MRSGVIQQRTGVIVNVFQRNPYSAHEAFRTGTEMHGIGMVMLFRADRKIQGLERPCAAAVDARQDFQNACIDGQSFRVRIEFPCIVYAHAAAVGPPSSPVEVLIEVVNQRVGARMKIPIREIDNREAVAVDVAGDT
jgi:hypothetical protein